MFPVVSIRGAPRLAGNGIPFSKRFIPVWLLLLALGVNPVPVDGATNWVIVGWNNLGMHCMDNDYSVFCTLPPYNTFHAQVILSETGKAQLVSDPAGYTVLYRAVADPAGSINKTSTGKGNFTRYSFPLFGLHLEPEIGLPVPGPESFSMPGTTNIPQLMKFETDFGWFAAYGVPITPYDDNLKKNSYPLMRLVASNQTREVASSDIVVPVSDEMDCRSCHSSGGKPEARPKAGWAWDPDPARDYRLNPLRLHDEHQATNPIYATALAARGFEADGLYPTVIRKGKPILCASCHASEALPGSGFAGVRPLTQAIHGLHADVRDPVTNEKLNDSANRTSCYRCHPGSDTRCLRGAMGRAVAVDGSLSMQCQACHGSMTNVASAGRTGWMNQPNCQACHTGDAVANAGQIRYESVFVSGSVMRDPLNRRFATNKDTPAAGLSLYRFSRGHGGLYCQACHGSTHAEYPSAFSNDNIISVQRQGHEGMLIDCASCHGASPSTVTNGPHGMHPVGQDWISGHRNPAKGGRQTSCRVCHGTDYRGTVLSRSMGNRVLTTNSDIGQKTFWPGYVIGCYACHLGPTQSSVNFNRAPVATPVATNTPINNPVAIHLTASDPDGNPVTVRIVRQPSNGRVGLSGTTATYYPDTSFEGVDHFAFAASDGSSESNLATGTVTVAGGLCSVELSPTNQVFDELSHVGIVTIRTGGPCPWLAASEAFWIQILTNATAGTGSVLYAVARNTESGSRTGSLWVSGQSFPVIQSGAPADANHDGLPDAWQLLHFGSTTDPWTGYASDPDEDGVGNGQEYLAGTSPTNKQSVLQITSFDLSNAVFVIGFPAVSNRYYQAQRADSLVAPQWVGFTNAVPGTGMKLYITDSADPASATQRFYRATIPSF